MKIQTTHTAASVHPPAIPGRFIITRMPSSSVKNKKESRKEEVYCSEWDVL
jgi:hypothetical protein